MPNVEDIYSWQHLERQPYGAAMWDVVEIDGKPAVVFMIREPTADLKGLPQSADVLWKTGAIGMTLGGQRVMPIVLMIGFAPLQSIYEVWFNFYGQDGHHTQNALATLAQQDHRSIAFHDRGSTPVRIYGFPNDDDQKTYIRGISGYCSHLPEWSDDDFNFAKYQLQKEYSVMGMWQYLK